MSNKDNMNHDDEYHFPSEEFITDDESVSADQGQHSDADDQGDEQVQTDAIESVADTSIMSRLKDITEKFPILKNKRIIGVVIIALIVLISFHFMSSGHKLKVVKKPVAKPVVVQSQPSLTTMNQMNTLKQGEAQNQASAAQLQANVQSLQASLNTARSQRIQMAKMLSNMSKQMMQLNMTVKRLAAKPKKHSGIVPPPLTFTVKAIIPGRVWLLGSNGLTETVTLGAKVPQYGTVTSINAKTGVVMTSSGKSIHYGGNDF